MDVRDELFAPHRGRCYQDQLHFAELVEILSDALTRYHGSGRRAIADGKKIKKAATRLLATRGWPGRLRGTRQPTRSGDLTR